MVESSDWSQSNEEVQFLFPVVLESRDGIEHLSSSLRVADPSYVLDSGRVDNVFNLGWRVELTHLSKGELPVSLILLWVKGGVVHAVLSSSLVAKPDIISISNQIKCWGLVCIIHNPTIS